ncbi:MAG: N-acetyltransferase, partial [Bacteroidales bacterium]|nr:N-acetyltransferase [Bacteroidales bacterium]
DLRYVAVVLDEHDRIVCFGICFPSIVEALRCSDGHITPRMLLKFLKAKKHPRVLDLGLVGVDPEFANMGISAIFSAALMRMLREDGIEYAETNLNLEDNYDIQNLWKRFGRQVHKRRRAFVKKLV